MKKILLILMMFWGVAYGQCPEVTNLTVSNLTTTTGKATYTAASGATLYVWGIYIPGGTFITGGSTTSTTFNFTGLSPSTTYRLKVKTTCGLSVSNDDSLTFSTLSAGVTYTPMTAAGYQFKYSKIDSGMAIPLRDTTIGRGIDRAGAMVYRPGDGPYIYNGISWDKYLASNTTVVTEPGSGIDSIHINPYEITFYLPDTTIIVPLDSAITYAALSEDSLNYNFYARGVLKSQVPTLVKGLIGADSCITIRDTTFNRMAVYFNRNCGGGGGSSPTLQQVLTAGSTLITNNTINYGSNTFSLGGINGIDLVTGDAGTNNIQQKINIYRGTSSIPVDGFGQSIDFVQSYRSPTSNYQTTSNKLESAWTTIDSATLKSQFNIKGIKNGIEQTFANFQTDGIVRVNNLADTLATKAYARSVGGGGGSQSLEQVLTVGDSANSKRIVLTDVGGSGIKIDITPYEAPGSGFLTGVGVGGGGFKIDHTNSQLSFNVTGSVTPLGELIGSIQSDYSPYYNYAAMEFPRRDGNFKFATGISVNGGTITDADTAGVFNITVGGGDINIYNSDDTLTGNRTVSLNNKSLTIIDTASYSGIIAQPQSVFISSGVNSASPTAFMNFNGSDSLINYNAVSHNFTGKITYDSPQSGTSSDSVLTWNATSKEARMRNASAFGISTAQLTDSLNARAIGYLTSSNYVFNEVPSGTINSSNVTFTIANTPTSGTVQVYVSGIRQKLTTHYSISGTTITFVTAPTTGSDIIVDYLK